MRTATLRDVARHAGVHPGTASRALNPRTRRLVNDETAERVREAAEQLGYRPNPIARSLKTSRSASVGVVIPDITNPLFPPIVRGVEDGLYPAGYSAWIVNTDNDAERESALVSSLRSRQVDGLIVATARLQHPLIEELAAENFPLVLVNRRIESPSVPAVTGDDARGVALAIRHLAELGHERIAHVAGPPWTSTGRGRHRAYRETLQELGLPVDPGLVAGCEAWSEQEGARALSRLLAKKARFTAVLAGNDLLALGCYDVLNERGLDCPADMSVVGFNDMAFVDKLRPPLTTVRIPHHQIGAEAARLLLDRVENRDTPVKSILLPLTLVERQSAAPPAR
ncbi:MAG: substrate-binding domain-containing protein [Streptosporangiales bacterium]|nr:substrate-binding domain-containing protein [Streptosporangiales bacterium]